MHSTGLAVTPPLVHKDTVICVASSARMVRDWRHLRPTGRRGSGTSRRAGRSLRHSSTTTRCFGSSIALTDGCWPAPARMAPPASGTPPPAHCLFRRFVHDTEVSCVAFHPAGRLLLTACSDNSLAERAAQQWDIRRANAVGPPLKHGDGVLWAVYSPDGTRVATASEDMTARIWDAATGSPVTRPLHHRHWVNSLEFSPDGRTLATCSGDGTARVWDVATGEPLSAPFLHRIKRTSVSVKFRPDGRAILTARTGWHGALLGFAARRSPRRCA